MYKILAPFLVALILLSGCVVKGPSTALRIITEESPPFNFSDERGNITGQSTELVREIMKKTGDGGVIEMLPWSQGYALVQKEPGTVLYSISRIPLRENMFKWVGPIGFADNWFYSRMGAGIKLDSLDDARKVKSIAVYRDDSNQLYLQEQGFTNLDISENMGECIRKLVNGQVDLWLGPAEGLHFIAYGAGVNPAEIEAVKYVRRAEWYIAFNKEAPDSTVQSWQKALDELKQAKDASGVSMYDKITTSYAIPQYVTDGVAADTVVKLVEKTAADITADAAGTIKKINAGEAPYLDKDNPQLYVYIYDTNVNEIANADNPAIVGRCLRGVPDIAGKLFRDRIVEGAIQNGKGWEDYVFTIPGKIGIYNKSAYYMLATGSDGKQYVVCAGRYTDKPEQ
ncbi:MAG: transporter substrate-binding domain-containing protein [Dehalococcoidia bacterium]|nr:transporter substrate-binding domain-containing protein [Dehalococcoidia bacterium]MDD5494534.1 transporter substrate-binding domain-containing protein [Dehalococcoidia bacterium]